MSDPTNDVTTLLKRHTDGDPSALPELIPLVYKELQKLASYYLQSERPGHTLQTTALVHEAYLRLVEQKADWTNRNHFFGIAAQTMRRGSIVPLVTHPDNATIRVHAIAHA